MYSDDDVSGDDYAANDGGDGTMVLVMTCGDDGVAWIVMVSDVMGMTRVNDSDGDEWCLCVENDGGDSDEFGDQNIVDQCSLIW